MGKNKLKKFADMDLFDHVFQCAMHEIRDGETNPALEMKGHWAERFFHNEHPITLELGCGHGEYTVGLAQQFPERNFIGIDIKGARMWHGAKLAKEAGLNNVAFLRINIEMLEHFFSADEIEQIWITFPDPQMKKATKRLTSTFFMARYRKLLIADGLIHLKTDSPFLYTYTRELIRLNHYPLLADTADLYHPGETDLLPDSIEGLTTIQTHYEKQWLDRGLSIKYLSFRLPAEPQLQEPDIEIEKDTYRSYGRNYVCTHNKS